MSTRSKPRGEKSFKARRSQRQEGQREREKPAEDTTPPTDATPDDDLREGRRREADEKIPLERLTTTTSVSQVIFEHWTSTSSPLFILRSTDNSVKDGSSSAL